MGIVKEELNSFDLENKGEVKIELNDSGNIHIHIGDFRMNLSKEEFKELSKAVEEGGENLREIKDDLE